MKKTELETNSLGAYLRRLRESKNLSLREAARQANISSAYLSQMEGGKTGKRKGAEDTYGPHPQILKKLAEVYHIPASELFVRAGYLEENKRTEGFSEEREIDRVFDFVMHDPLLKSILTVPDKRAIVNRYEALTGKRLITWAGESDLHSSISKPEFSGLVSSGGILLADTPHNQLSIEEVASELGVSNERVKAYLKNGWLEYRKDPQGNVMISKTSLRGLKDYAMRDGLTMREIMHHNEHPATAKEFKQAAERVEEIKEKELPNTIRAIAEAAHEKVKSKMP